MNNQSLGTLSAQMMLDIRQWQANAQQAQNSLKSVAKTALALKAVGEVTDVMEEGFRTTVKASMELEQSIKNAAAVTREAQDNFDDLKNKALEVSATSGHSAREIGSAFLYMGRSGMHAEDMLKGVRSMSQLASAAMVDLGKATDVATDTMTAMGKTADDLTHINDVLLTTTIRTNTSFEQLGDSMKYVAPTAHAMKQSLETTTAAIGLLANAGIKGSQAGTVLRQGMLRLIKPMRTSQKAMRRLGLQVIDNQGKMMDFVSIIGQLEDAQKRYGNNSARFAEDLGRLFGTEAVSGMQALVAQGSGHLAYLRSEMEAAKGTAALLEAQMLDTFGGQVKVAQGNFENLAATVGDKLTPYIRALVEESGRLAAEWMDSTKNSQELEEIIHSLATIFASLLDAFSAIVTVGGYLMQVFSALYGFGEALAYGISGLTSGWIALGHAMVGNKEKAEEWGRVAEAQLLEVAGAFARTHDRMVAIDKTSTSLSNASQRLSKSLGGVNVKLRAQEQQLKRTQKEFDTLMKAYRSGGFIDMAMENYETSADGGDVPLAKGQRRNGKQAVTDKAHSEWKLAQAVKVKARQEEARRRAKAAADAEREAQKQLDLFNKTYDLQMQIHRETDAATKAEMSHRLRLQQIAAQQLDGAREIIAVKKAQMAYEKDLINIKKKEHQDAMRRIEQEAQKVAALAKQKEADAESLRRYRRDRRNSGIGNASERSIAEHQARLEDISKMKDITTEQRELLVEKSIDQFKSEMSDIQRQQRQRMLDIAGGIGDQLIDGIGDLMGVGDNALGRSMMDLTKQLQNAKHPIEAAAMAGQAWAQGLIGMVLEHKKTQQHFKVLRQAVSDLGIPDVLGEFLSALEPGIGAFVQITQDLKPIADLLGGGGLKELVQGGFLKGIKVFFTVVLGLAEGVAYVSKGIATVTYKMIQGMYILVGEINQVINNIGLSIDIKPLQNATRQAEQAVKNIDTTISAIDEAQKNLKDQTIASGQAIYDETKLRAELNEQLREGVRNGPAGYKMDLARFEATSRGAASIGMLESRQQGMYVETIIVQAQNVEDFQRQLELKMFRQTGSTNTMQSGIVRMSTGRVRL